MLLPARVQSHPGGVKNEDMPYLEVRPGVSLCVHEVSYCLAAVQGCYIQAAVTDLLNESSTHFLEALCCSESPGWLLKDRTSASRRCLLCTEVWLVHFSEFSAVISQHVL